MTTDTQWPRFELFLQDKNGRSHKSVGTIHAADGEMALLNARDVYVRRPNCVSLWVAPSDKIFIKTAAELKDNPSWHDTLTRQDGDEQIYFVFQKQSQRRAMTYVVHTGQVVANSPEHALKKAIDQDNTGKQTFVWWICPASAITRSNDDDVESMFAPALSKPYKHPAHYKTFTAIRQAKAARETS